MARPKKLTRSMLTSLAVVLLIASSALRLFAVDDGADQPDKTQKLLPTHKQVLTIRPEMNGEPAQLATFCLDQSGNILACVSGTGNALQFLTPTGELIRQIDLPFAPQGIGQSPSGIIFLAGPGKLAKLSAEGEILTIVDSPWLGDVEQMKTEAQVAAEEQMAAVMGSFTEMIEKIDARIAKMEEKPEADRTERDFKRLQAMKEQKKAQEEQAAEMKDAYGQMFSVDAMLNQRMRVTALAVNEQDLFVCSGGAGYSYEVWRMNHEFAEPTKVVDALSGCCGQCDIQCDQDHLIIAANTKFSVELLDRDGKAVSKFGQQGGQNGFGSCCNPMNVRSLGSGDILTAESSIGWIKRFNKEGELQAVIGKAKIGGGCKHVPIGFDAKLDRYYMMYEDKSEICVLVPLSEAIEPTADEIAAKEARDGLGQKLIGQWQAVPVSKNKPDTAGASVPAIKIVPANDAESNADGAKAERKVNETITIEAGKSDARVVAGENVTASSGRLSSDCKNLNQPRTPQIIATSKVPKRKTLWDWRWVLMGVSRLSLRG